MIVGTDDLSIVRTSKGHHATNTHSEKADVVLIKQTWSGYFQAFYNLYCITKKVDLRMKNGSSKELMEM